MIPFYFLGMPVGADFDNHYRFALPLYDEISKGNFFPGWLAESNNGFGDPRFRFYPPFLYYLLCGFRFLTGDWYYATLAVFTIFSVIGVSGVYLWTRRSLSQSTSLLAAFLFAIVPYHLTQFYQASLLAEFVAMAFLPFAFMFVERLMSENEDKKHLLFNIGGLAVSYSLIITTHLPTTVISSYSLGVFALLLTNWKNYRKLIFCAVGILLGLTASSWFWVKMISELNWIQAGKNVSSPYYDYRNNFVFSLFSATNLNTWYGSLLASLTFGIFLPTLLIIWQIFKIKSDDANNQPIEKYFAETDNLKIKRRLMVFLVIAIGSLLMTTDLSRPLWAIIPKLKDIQFPYRWLTITSIMICPLTALALQIWRERIWKDNIRPFQYVLLLGFILSVGTTFYELVIRSDFISREKFIERIEEARGARSFKDWLPNDALELKDLSPLNGNIEAGTRKITVMEWDSHRRIFSVEAGENTQARLRSYYYPLWQAFIVKDGRKQLTIIDKANDGTLLVSLPTEKSEIEVTFQTPLYEKISLITAILGWTIALALLIISFFIKTKDIN